MWTHTLLTVGAMLAAAVAIGWAEGDRAASIWLGISLAALALYHLWHQQRLMEWLALPRQRVLPQGWGSWAAVLDRLAQVVRAERDTREALAGELERIHAAVDRLPDALVVLDRFDHVVWANRAAETLLGIYGVQLPIHHYLRAPEFLAALQSREQDAWPVRLQLPLRPGRTFEVQLTEAAAQQRLMVTRDVTEAQRLDAMRRDFVANVSHEIRTPLTVIAGFVETMIDLPVDEATRRAYLETILKQTSTMRQLVEDLLQLSTLEHGGGAATDGRVDLHGLLSGLAADARVLSAGRHEITLALEGPRHVVGNAGELQSAVRNLLTNAIRYTPAGGHIVLRWRRVDAEGWISVRDDGIGIAAEHLPRVTERFYRVDRARSRDTGGTGLGLAIVKHIVQHHQAQLAIESTPGAGSTFTIRLPAARLADERPAGPDHLAAERSSNAML